MTNETTLTYQVYVTPILATATKDLPPGQSRATWSPISATLISGRRDAVLVDPLMTVEQGMAVADWVSTTGKNLTTVYVTHGHGDHWFGLGAVRERFPASGPWRRRQSSRPCANGPRLRCSNRSGCPDSRARSPGTSATGRTTTPAPSTKPASNSVTSTGSTRKPRRPRTCTGRCWRFTRTASTPTHCGGQRSRPRPEPESDHWRGILRPGWAMKSSSAWLTSSAWVQMIACGPPAITLERAFFSNAGSLRLVAS
jgi:Metallo-beta-lactamase superfamily